MSEIIIEFNVKVVHVFEMEKKKPENTVDWKIMYISRPLCPTLQAKCKVC